MAGSGVKLGFPVDLKEEQYFSVFSESFHKFLLHDEILVPDNLETSGGCLLSSSRMYVVSSLPIKAIGFHCTSPCQDLYKKPSKIFFEPFMKYAWNNLQRKVISDFKKN